MEWKGEEIITVKDLINKVISKCKDKNEAQEFMQLYRSHTKYADSNIGYISGYFDEAERRRIQDWFGVSHPVIGKD